MTIGPRGMLALRRACRVEQTGLCQQDKRSLGMVTMPHCFLRRSDFLQSAPQMHGCGTQTFIRFPRNWARQGIVNLEYAGTVTILLELTAVRRRQPVARYAQQLARSHIAERDIIRT